jgi:hypothetical protein
MSKQNNTCKNKNNKNIKIYIVNKGARGAEALVTRNLE